MFQVNDIMVAMVRSRKHPSKQVTDVAIRNLRIQRLKTLVESGTYHVDIEELLDEVEHHGVTIDWEPHVDHHGRRNDRYWWERDQDRALRAHRNVKKEPGPRSHPE